MFQEAIRYPYTKFRSVSETPQRGIYYPTETFQEAVHYSKVGAILKKSVGWSDTNTFLPGESIGKAIELL